jgi:Lrp/AsnC family transcriptional regulator, leucine-responsive regulatory protein
MVRPDATARQAFCLNLLDSTVMDEIDDRILGILATNGRASFAALGEAVGLSPHGAADRVRRLERDGVITGYTARIDPAGVGRSLDAFIDVRLLPTTDPEKFERRVAKLASVREMAFLTGRFDYQLRVACRDADDLNSTVRAIRQGGAAGTETRIVLRASRFDRGAARTD